MDKSPGSNQATVVLRIFADKHVPTSEAPLLNWSREWISQQDDIISQVERLLLKIVGQRISDIHIEPYADQYRIRLRQDGLLYNLIYIQSSIAGGIIARLKVLSHLDVAEKRLPQDGHFSLKYTPKNVVDFRLSTCPTVDGEKMVIRILNPTTISTQIEELGLEIAQKQLFVSTLNKPQGLILFIGPTGSGKTVSIYAALEFLNPSEKNILTVEDPVEINIPGINQVNINPKVGLTFSSALKTFLRQDPDVITVGEVRDVETAQIVIKAAQTGHLILSTLHAQNTVQAFDRLLNLGLSKAQIQSNLLLLIAQRLLRTLCEACKRPAKLSQKILDDYELSTQDVIFEAEGCSLCQSGYVGRIGIFELLHITEKVIAEFSKANHRPALEAILKKNRLSLRDRAIYKVKQGITSFAEINRIIP